jgi:chorismate synthase
MSSEFGNKIRLTVFGESHGEAVGCVIDGLPAGVKLDTDMINREMQRRAPGRDASSTARKEKDAPRILSGVLDGVTTGAPLAMIIENENAQSGDYSDIMNIPRPSHADYPAYIKFGGNNDVRGGGHFSGRLTAPIVFAGAVAKQLLAEKGVTVAAHIAGIGSVCDSLFDRENLDAQQLKDLSQKSFALIDGTLEEKMRGVIAAAKADGDSVGGSVECAAVGVPAGLGGNIFSTVESQLASALFAVPAVKGVEFGAGFALCEMTGSQANDTYRIKDGRVHIENNNNGGILGGITTAAPIVFRAAIKPTPSIAKPQKSVNLQTMQDTVLEIRGRHDPCIVVRAVPVIEAVTALVLLDLMI